MQGITASYAQASYLYRSGGFYSAHLPLKTVHEKHEKHEQTIACFDYELTAYGFFSCLSCFSWTSTFLKLLIILNIEQIF